MSKLSKLRKDLKGKQATVAKSLGVEPSTISRLLNGKSYNEDLLKDVIAQRDKIQKQRQQILAKI